MNISDSSSGLTGLEPAASALTGRCSDQLNYNPCGVCGISILKNHKKIRFVCRTLRNRRIIFSFISMDLIVFLWKKKMDLVHINEALHYWAELDLNQRRHIANEFTVRPH